MDWVRTVLAKIPRTKKKLFFLLSLENSFVLFGLYSLSLSLTQTLPFIIFKKSFKVLRIETPLEYAVKLVRRATSINEENFPSISNSKINKNKPTNGCETCKLS